MALSGDLSEFHLQDLLQILALGRKTGVLSVRGDTAAGSLSLVAGRLEHAEGAGASGEKAFFLLVQNRRGPFVFKAGDQESAARHEPTIRSSLQVLLMEASEWRETTESGGVET